jgi:hypothetical protein
VQVSSKFHSPQPVNTFIAGEDRHESLSELCAEDKMFGICDVIKLDVVAALLNSKGTAHVTLTLSYAICTASVFGLSTAPDPKSDGN